MLKVPSSARLSTRNVAGTKQSQPRVIPKTSNFWFDSNKGTCSSNKDNAANTVNNGIKRTRKSDNLNPNHCLKDLSKPVSGSLSVADGSKFLVRDTSLGHGGYGDRVLNTKSPCLEDLSKPASDSSSLVAINNLLDQCELSDDAGYGYYVDPSVCETHSNFEHGKSSPLSDETEEYTSEYTSDSDDAEKKCPTTNRSLSIAKNLNSLLGTGLAVDGAPGSGHKATRECSDSSDEDDAMFFPMDGI